MSIFASFVGVVSILPYCYYASRITVRMQQLSNVIFDSCWYKLPVRLQRNIQFMIKFAQVTRKVDGYILFSCDLECFVKVGSKFLLFILFIAISIHFFLYFQIMKTSVSYYLLFKNFS